MADLGQWARLLWILAGLGAGAQAAAPTPDGRNALVPDRPFDLERLELDLKLQPEARAVEGTARFTLRRLGPGPLVLDQVALEIAAVRQAGVALPWRTSGDTLVIDVPQVNRGVEIPPVEVEYRAVPRTGLHWRLPGRGAVDGHAEVWTQGEQYDHRHWFPSFDHPNDRFAYEGHIQAPEGWRVHTNSGPDLVNYLVMVAAGDYEEVVHPADPSLKLWVPPGTSPQATARVLDPLPAMRALFEVRTGQPWPWEGYLQVYAQRFPYGGMENTGATINDARQLVDDRVGHRQRTERVVAHELAHQWFGDLLTCRTFRELWLNEGFATFMEAEWERHQHGEHAYAGRLDDWTRWTQSGPALAGRFYHPEGAPVSGSVYAKGGKVLHMLRAELGEAVFWEGVARYVALHKHQLVDTIDLQRAMEEVSGRDLGWFFQQWVELAAIPAVGVKHRYQDGVLHVDFTQKIGPEQPRFTLPLRVAVGLAGGGEATLTGYLEGPSAHLQLKLDAPPAYVAVDPEGALLVQLQHDQDPAAWAAQALRAAPYARRVAVQALGETDHKDALVAILNQRPADEEERHRLVPLREAAVLALGAQRAHLAELSAAATDPSARVRIAAAQGLGRLPGEGSADLLSQLLRRDPNPDVQAAALRALAKVQPKAALPLARRLCGLKDVEEQELRAAALDVVGEHGAPGDLALLLDPTAPGSLRNDGLEAAIALAARLEGPARTAVVEPAARFGERLLLDDDIRTRGAAAEALGALGSPRSIDALEAYRRVEREPDLVAGAEQAIQAVRRAPKGGPARPKAEAEVLIEALEARVKALEEAERAADKAGARPGG